MISKYGKKDWFSKLINFNFILQISRDGNSQLQRLINNIDNPEKTKPMKAVSLGELNTVDLYFIVVAILERRIITCEEQNDALKKSLKKAQRKIARLEEFIQKSEKPKGSSEMLSETF